MKISKSAKYSALLFLIFILGVIFFIAYINKSLNKKTEIFPVESKSTSEGIVSAIEE